MLLDATDEEGDGGGMSDTQVRDEAITLFLAGQETMANSLAWTWYLLSQNPVAEAKLHDEIDTILGGRPPSVEDLGRLPYTHGIFKEALRIYPAAWTLARRAVADYEVGGYTIPAGADIYMSQFVMHRDSRFFPTRWNSGPRDGAPGKTRRCPNSRTSPSAEARGAA